MAAMTVSRLIEDGVVVTYYHGCSKDDSTFIYDKEKMIWDPLRIAEQMKSEDRYSLIDRTVTIVKILDDDFYVDALVSNL
jgi:predicted lipoprotein with Yx(FWY)xxD motif